MALGKKELVRGGKSVSALLSALKLLRPGNYHTAGVANPPPPLKKKVKSNATQCMFGLSDSSAQHNTVLFFHLRVKQAAPQNSKTWNLVDELYPHFLF